MTEIIKLGDIGGNKQQNRVHSIDGLMPTITANNSGGRRPGGLILIEDNDELYTKGERNLTKTNEVNTEVSGKPFKFVELFAGIGGFRAGLDKLGGECVLAVEWDKFAQQSYTALYGNEHLLGDVTKVNEHDVPDHDVLVFGMPCQAFSVAGKRLGFEDMRGTLYFEAIRIAKAKKPKLLLMENVKGLISHDKGRTLDVMAQAMSDIGYTIDFNVLNSKYFGVPQNRERIFMVGVRDDLVSEQPWTIEGTNVVAKGKRRIGGLECIKTFNFDFPSQMEVTTRLRDILEAEVDDKYYLSDEKTSALIAQLDKAMPAHFPTIDGVNNTIRTGGKGSLTAKHNYEYIAIEDGLPIREATVQGYAIAREGDAVNFQFPDSKTRRGRVGKQIANTLEASNINQGVVESEVRPVLTPDRIEKGQNGRRFKENGEESFTLTAQDKHGVAIGQQPKYRIRKLTPLECWRLQGFTDEQHQTVVDAGLSDSQRYKQAGNAVTVNVIHAIGERLLPYLS